MRALLLILSLAAFPVVAFAIEAPQGQVRLDAGKVLRGNFVDERQMPGMSNPLRSSGHFVVAPARGLIWSIEKPFSTSTIITPNAIAQDIGGMAVKLPAKNLQHLYTLVGSALAGDWDGLETDFVVTRSGTAEHWQILLTPRPDKSRLPYTSVIVSGGRFVENIAMMKGDSSSDTLSFTDETLSPAPLAATEIAVFNEVRP